MATETCGCEKIHEGHQVSREGSGTPLIKGRSQTKPEMSAEGTSLGGRKEKKGEKEEVRQGGKIKCSLKHFLEFFFFFF